MPRPRRRRRPPGNAVVICTGRGQHKRHRIRRIQLAAEGGRITVLWDQREGPAPVAAYREDGGRTLAFACPACRRDWKRGDDMVAQIVIALGRMQGLQGADNTPVTVDISRIDRA